MNKPFIIFTNEDDNWFARGMEESIRASMTKSGYAGAVIPEKGIFARNAVEEFVNKTLPQDIINHASLLRYLYRDNPIIEKICNEIDNHAYSGEFMSSIAELCNSCLQEFNSDQNFQYNSEVNIKVYELCTALANHRLLLLKWPTITTLEGMINASQKIAFTQSVKSAYSKSENEGGIKKELQDNFDDLIYQIEHSDASTNLQEIIKKDSSFLKVKGYDTERMEEWLKNRSIRPIVKMLNPKVIVGDIVNGQEKKYQAANLSVHAELIKMRHNYLKKSRGKTHCSDIDNLINRITELLSDDYYSYQIRYESVIKTIQKAYNQQKTNYTKYSSFFFERTEQGFINLLQKNDNSYCYPRGLKNILDISLKIEKKGKLADFCPIVAGTEVTSNSRQTSYPRGDKD